MLHTPIEMEYLVHAHCSDLHESAFRSRRQATARATAAGSPSGVRLAVGLGLIALGERLAGRRSPLGAVTNAQLRPAGNGLH